mmetsp:Transcript_45617/g.111027  ORF Transcript_45617/g.111027 Transcript_45617/m.111027 type:complete len:233 (-) Transcript_45617:173-871(-)
MCVQNSPRTGVLMRVRTTGSMTSISYSLVGVSSITTSSLGGGGFLAAAGAFCGTGVAFDLLGGGSGLAGVESKVLALAWAGAGRSGRGVMTRGVRVMAGSSACSKLSTSGTDMRISSRTWTLRMYCRTTSCRDSSSLMPCSLALCLTLLTTSLSCRLSSTMTGPSTGFPCPLACSRRVTAVTCFRYTSSMSSSSYLMLTSTRRPSSPLSRGSLLLDQHSSTRPGKVPQHATP